MKHLLRGLFIAVLLICCNFQSVLAQPMQQLPVDKNVRIGKLDNGLTYYIRATGASAVKDKYISDTSTSFWSGTQDGNKVTLGGAGGKITDYSTRKLYTHIGNANVGM